MNLFIFRRDELALDNEAAEWLVRLDDHEPEIQEKFFAWLQKSPRHVNAFLGIAGAFRMLDKLDPQRRIDVQALITEAGSNVVPIRGDSSTITVANGEPSPPQTSRRLWLIASSVVVFVAIGWLAALNVQWGAETYQTAIGELREVRLDDGSVLSLNTRSRVQVNFSEHERKVRLLQGEALFTVAHDTTRPFRVDAGGSIIQAVGTQFNVYRHENGATVTVSEGVVRITSSNAAAVSTSASSSTPETAAASVSVRESPTQLAAGEVANVVTDGRVVKKQKPDIDQELAWQKRELVFTDASLEFVAEQFNRYNKKQIRLQGSAIRSKQISGIFSTYYPQSLVLFLKSDPALHVEEMDDGLVIRTN